MDEELEAQSEQMIGADSGGQLQSPTAHRPPIQFVYAFKKVSL